MLHRKIVFLTSISCYLRNGMVNEKPSFLLETTEKVLGSPLSHLSAITLTAGIPVWLQKLDSYLSSVLMLGDCVGERLVRKWLFSQISVHTLKVVHTFFVVKTSLFHQGKSSLNLTEVFLWEVIFSLAGYRMLSLTLPRKGECLSLFFTVVI